MLSTLLLACHGPTRPTLGTVDAKVATEPTWIEVAGPTDRYGVPLAEAGDVDADGYQDLLVADPGSRVVHLHRGGPAGFSPTPDATLSVAGATAFGVSISGGVDLDGDAYDDAVLGGNWLSTHHGASSGLGDERLDVEGTHWNNALVLPDLDGDGCPELVTSSGQDSLLDNFGAGTRSVGGTVRVAPGFCDHDGDAWVQGAECDDADPGRYPDADDPPGDGIDQDCNGDDDCCTDADGDAARSDVDCDDGNASVGSDDPEACNGIDDDCDGAIDDADGSLEGAPTWYRDTDGDGFGRATVVTVACVGPPLTADATGDCNDVSGAVSPGAAEVCNGIDDDCDGLVDAADDTVVGGAWYADGDGDGYGDPLDFGYDCSSVGGRVDVAGDCDDLDGAVNPGATDECGNEVDDDCDGVAPPECGFGIDA